MNHRRTALLALLALTACSANDPEPDTPDVDIAYAGKYDALCSMVGPPIRDEWRKELDSLIPQFRKEWEVFGRPITSAAAQLSATGFRPRPYSVGLTLCNSSSEDSWSGIRVNMRYALGSFTDAPVSVRYKVVTLVHELLHELIRKIPLNDSRLLAQHQAEPERVSGHLHLLALLKAAMLRSGQNEALEETIRIDSQLPGGFYKRAWDIVNATPDTYLEYVRELGAGASS